MTTVRIAFIRHGPTAWNREKRLQGRADPPLDALGRVEVEGWIPPAEILSWPVVASPLTRTRQTAEILFGNSYLTEAALIETNFGDWEGRRISDLRHELGSAMTENEARGLDFQPPGGESPRQVQARVLPLLRGWAAQGGDRVCVTHKGVIRAVLAEAFDWPMTGRAPVRLNWDAVHVFTVDSDGSIVPDRLNLSMVAKEAPA